MSHILAFAGSLRKDSWNKKILPFAVEGARKAGAEVTVIDLRDFQMPIYDQDIEDASGLPENALKLKKIFKEHQGLLLACPEYNSSITGVLKNTIDWISRPVDKEDGLEPFKNKLALLISASPGALGGLRCLVHVRAILGNIGVTVLPEQRAVGKVHEAFLEDGSMKDAKTQEALATLGAGLAQKCAKWVA